MAKTKAKAKTKVKAKAKSGWAEIVEPRARIRAFDAEHRLIPPRRYTDGDPTITRFQAGIAALHELLDGLAESLVVYMQESPGIAQKRLDRSVRSLAALDAWIEANDVPNLLKRDFLDRHLVPALGGYVATTVVRTLPNLLWRFGRGVESHVLMSTMGGYRFLPFAFARDMAFSGYRAQDFHATIARAVARTSPGREKPSWPLNQYTLVRG